MENQFLINTQPYRISHDGMQDRHHLIHFQSLRRPRLDIVNDVYPDGQIIPRKVSGFDCLVWVLAPEDEEELEDGGKDADVGERAADEVELYAVSGVVRQVPREMQRFRGQCRVRGLRDDQSTFLLFFRTIQAALRAHALQRSSSGAARPIPVTQRPQI